MPKNFDLKVIESTAQVLISVLERKNPYTKGHSRRVSDYVLLLAQAIRPKLTQIEVELLRLGGLVHDIGKTCVEEYTLNNPSRHLSDSQIVELENHPHDGVQILRKSTVDIPDAIIECVFFHHERYDGDHKGDLRGYPLGYAGEKIPLPGRITAISDTFDAMTTSRSYQEKLSINDAVMRLKDLAGKSLDPALVEIFIQHVVPQINSK
ncbi:MAG: HD domain-containing phosphohydrolase [Patescibacteria group bacterium]|jgi:putative nucleotidyltransferase with HDIG domain